MNLGIEGDLVENVLRWAISLLLPSSVRKLVAQWGAKNISTCTFRDIANCIIDVGSSGKWSNLEQIKTIPS